MADSTLVEEAPPSYSDVLTTQPPSYNTATSHTTTTATSHTTTDQPTATSHTTTDQPTATSHITTDQPTATSHTTAAPPEPQGANPPHAQGYPTRTPQLQPQVELNQVTTNPSTPYVILGLSLFLGFLCLCTPCSLVAIYYSIRRIWHRAKGDKRREKQASRVAIYCNLCGVLFAPFYVLIIVAILVLSILVD